MSETTYVATEKNATRADAVEQALELYSVVKGEGRNVDSRAVQRAIGQSRDCGRRAEFDSVFGWCRRAGADRVVEAKLMDLKLIAGAAMGAIREQLPESSPLAGVEGEGRMDVLASRALERMAYGCGDPNVAAQPVQRARLEEQATAPRTSK